MGRDSRKPPSDNGKISFRAIVSSAHDPDGFACIIRHGTVSGCQIVTSRIADLPDDIFLKVEALHDVISGRIVRRDMDTAEVEFRWDRDNALTNERRGAARRKANIPVMLYDADGTQTAFGMICDTSRTGCRIQCGKLATLGDDIVLEIKGITGPMKGRIAWRDKTVAGVALTWSEIAPDDADEHAGKVYLD